MSVAEGLLRKMYGDYVTDPPVLPTAVVFFVAVTVLLTFPILLRPDRIHLTAPPAYSFLHEGDWFLHHPTKGQEYVDHLGAKAGIEGTARRLSYGENPFVVDPDYTIPPSYIFVGVLTTVLLPVSTITFHNLFFVCSMFLAGVFAFLFVREVLDDVAVAALAGVLYISSFYVFNVYVMGHTNQWQIQWIPLILFGIERMRTDVETRFVGRTAVILGLAFSLQVLSSMQYSAYLSFILPLYLVLRTIYGAREFRSLLFWKGYGAATVLAVVVTAPYLYVRLRFVQTGATDVSTLQADMNEWYHVQNVIGEFFAADAQLQFFFRLLLVIGGFVTLLTVSRQRFRQLIPFAFLFGIGVMISWGPFSPWAPYSLLHRYWPLIEYFRVPYRMLPFAILGSSTLTASLLLHLPDSDTKWSRYRLAAVGVITTIQIALVHHSLVFSEYLR